MSSGFTTSPILTSAVTACPPSLTPREIAICECSSIIPLVKCFPFPSIMSMSFGSSPLFLGSISTLLIFPFSINIVALLRMPSCSFVQTVTFLIAILWDFGIESIP